MARVAILGCAGYSGQETLDRVLAHPELEPVALGSDSLAGQPVAALDPRLVTAGAPDLDTHEEVASVEPPADAIVVDLSGAHRLQDTALYREWYGFEHPAPDSLAGWSYA